MVTGRWISIPLLLLSLSAGAEEAEHPPAQEPARSLLSADLTDPYRASRGPQFETDAWRRVQLRKGGVEVRRQLTLGDRDVVVGVKGPLLKKKRLGLKFEVRF